jgi:GT2 family glycosyltransferase/glycosyltransferase involved in cell wall biosynthesis
VVGNPVQNANWHTPVQHLAIGDSMQKRKTDEPPPAEFVDARTTEELRTIFDAEWYLEKYPDLRAIDHDPLTHYILYGAAEGRDPNGFFDGAWYHARYPDVAATGYPALLHYLTWGARELRNPHPRFDAAYYIDMHPEAAANPLLYHIRVGASHGWATERSVNIRDFLPSETLPPSCPDGLMVDVIVAAYRGLQETQDCLESVLADPDRPSGRVIVMEDCSPEPKLVAWLRKLANAGSITLVHNARNLGFVASVNRGMEVAGAHDVALLNSDTVVPHGWLRRLAARAYAVPRVASVSPFSNNATICGYPSVSGVSPAFGCDVHAIDAACRAANAGRAIEVPTTVGFCMYIRRAALNDVGLFDHETFGRGYGEENDFCMRAVARGWRHMLACDTYVFHEGNVSFGQAAARSKQRAVDALVARYPDYRGMIDRHVLRDGAAPACFAATAALLRASGKPSVLMISHQLGGGVQRHIDELVERLGATANVLLLRSSPRGVSLSVPALPGHSVLALAGDRLDDLVTYLRTTNLCRVHVHHVLGLDLNVPTLLRRLDLGFDLTVHDYFAICPQVNLLPNPNQQYCGEPGPATCNACIAQRPSHGAREILSWRRTHGRLLLEADRVLCPSEDVRARLARYGLARNAVVAPHEVLTEAALTVRPPPLQAGKPLRIALIGVLAGHKGEISVVTLAEAVPPSEISLHLIGYVENALPASVAARISVSGTYKETELAGLLAAAKPHVVWFPAQWPETYSYTLSAALEARLPIVATRIGAFPERLEGRKLTWLVDPAATTEAWRAVFREVRTALEHKAPPGESPGTPKTAARRPVVDFYARDYATPLSTPAVRRGEIDLRQPGRVSVLVIPERLPNGELSPCTYIRLLQPLDHPAVADGIDVVMADAHEVSRFRADIIATQRYAIPDVACADALAARCRETGARLLYDIDDDLLHIPRDHPEAEMLRPRARTVARMLHHADAVWVSTQGLAAALRETLPTGRSTMRVMPNGLDERLWGTPATETRKRPDPVRLLFMGTATHGGDWAIVAPAMARVAATFGPGVTFDMIGVLGPEPVPAWVNRVSPSNSGMASYPGFVNWITCQPVWDIGIAPLADTAFNRGKSAIKTMDYAALGLAMLASDVPAYRGSLVDGAGAVGVGAVGVGADGAGAVGGADGSAGGRLVANTEAAWFRALCELIRNAASRQALAARARTAFIAHHTIAAQAHSRRAAWLDLVSVTPAAITSTRRRPAQLAAD